MPQGIPITVEVLYTYGINRVENQYHDVVKIMQDDMGILIYLGFILIHFYDARS